MSVIVDMGYDANSFRQLLEERKTEAVIPSTPSRKQPLLLDHEIYRRRNLIERLLCRLKNWRRVATRYDRLARNYLASLALISIVTEWAM